MAKVLKNKNYIAIADWMLDLKLNTRELLTYALIYGFCQDNEGCYYGSLEYLANWLGIEDRTNATRYLKPLVEKGLITKEDVRTKINQKACIYRTLINRGDPTKDAETDYIIIQPWMVQNLHLNGKDLLLYALVYSYSRKGSNNFCSYTKEYFAKWLQCRKDHLDRQIKKAIDKYLIKSVEGGFVAIVPKEISIPQTDNTPNFKEFDFTQIDNTFTHSDNTSSPKLTTNNLVLDNLKDNLIFLNNNNSNNLKSSEYEFSVVVNKELLFLDYLTKQEKEILESKIQYDLETLKKYHCENWVIKFMSSISDTKLRYLCIYDKQNIFNKDYFLNKAELLCLKHLKKYKNYISKISSDKLLEIYDEAIKIFDPDRDDEKYIRNEEGYLIGIIKNIMEIS